MGFGHLRLGLTGAETVWYVVYWAVGLSLGAVCLYGIVVVVRTLDDLAAASMELAEAALERERDRYPVTFATCSARALPPFR